MRISKLLRTVALVASLVFSLASVSYGDAGTIKLNSKADGSGSDVIAIHATTVGFYLVPSTGISNSAIFQVTSHAIICPVTSTLAGASGTIYVSLSDTTTNGSFTPSSEPTSVLSASSGDCFDASKRGVYWIAISGGPSSGTAKFAVIGY